MTSAASQSLPNFSERRLATNGVHFILSKHAVEALFRRERRFDKAQAHAGGAKDERRENHADRRKAHTRHIADIDRRTDEDEQNDLRRQPELAEFFREPLGNERRTLHLEKACHTDDREQARHGHDAIEPALRRDEQQRHAQHDDDLHAVADAMRAGIGGLEKAAQKPPHERAQRDAKHD